VGSRGVTVNCIAPGLIETAMTEKLTEEQRAKILAGVPLGRMGLPREVAAGVLYLASEEAAYVTGATIDINGGGDML
jgi:3-oxoacyl-[acyl-carrier protein] reductase